MKRVAFLGLLLAATGCCSHKACHPAVREFQRKHPEEYKRYAFIYPTTLAIHMALVADRISAVCEIAEKLQEEYGSVPGISEFAQDIIKQENLVRQTTIKWAREMERLMGKDGAICQYEWGYGVTKEVGLLVLRNGHVAKREVWFVEYSREDPEQCSEGTASEPINSVPPGGVRNCAPLRLR
jgi:hypothetical protein